MRMAFRATILNVEAYRPRYPEGMVSVEQASDLQRLSMKRFQHESVNDMQLRRFLGHVSVNRRSTEIVQTATFEEEIFAEIEDQSLHDEDAIWNDLSPPQKTTSLPVGWPPGSKDTREEWMSLSLMMHPIDLVEKVDIIDVERCQADGIGMISNSTADELLMAIDQDWMYDVLNLHIRDSGSVQPLSRPVAIQLWRKILESLAGYTNKKIRAQEAYDMRQLEAHGLPKSDELFGLGFDCNQIQHTTFSSLAEVAQ